jgi:fumarate hydratase class I
LDDKSSVRVLAKLENRIVRDTNKLGIGAMGLGGAVTILGAKIGALSRVPASFYVTISFMCWAYRRRGVVLGPEGETRRQLYR